MKQHGNLSFETEMITQHFEPIFVYMFSKCLCNAPCGLEHFCFIHANFLKLDFLTTVGMYYIIIILDKKFMSVFFNLPLLVIN